MAQPTQGDVHVNRPLTNVSIAFIQKQEAYIAARMFPNVPVQKQGDLYFTYPKGSWFKDEARPRAPGTETAGGGYTMSSDSYFCNPIGFHKDVDDQLRSNADAPINVDRDATEFVTQKMLLKRDIDWKARYFTTSVWTGSTSGSDITPGTLWSAALSTPIADITAQIFSIHGKTGYKPNKLCLGPAVWQVLKNHPDFLDRVKYGADGGRPAQVSLKLLAEILELDEVMVAEAVQNTAVEGATDAMGFMFGKHALLCYAAPTPSLMAPSAGYTFSWTGYLGAGAMGSRIKRFRMENLSSDRIEGEMAYDLKVVAPELGCFFSSAVA